MGIPFTLPMGFLLTIALAIQLTISSDWSTLPGPTRRDLWGADA